MKFTIWARCSLGLILIPTIVFIKATHVGADVAAAVETEGPEVSVDASEVKDVRNSGEMTSDSTHPAQPVENGESPESSPLIAKDISVEASSSGEDEGEGEGEDEDEDEDEKGLEKSVELGSVGPLSEPTESLASSANSLKLSIRRWAPEMNDSNQIPKGLVILHHGGVGWHSGYFGVIAEALSKHGYHCIAYDMQGCGHSEGVGPRGYFHRFRDLTGDLAHIIDVEKGEVERRYPGYTPKVFVFAEDFGAIVALAYALQTHKKHAQATVDGYLFSSPVLRIKPRVLPSGLVVQFLKLVALFAPKMKLQGLNSGPSLDSVFGDKKWADAAKRDALVAEAIESPIFLQPGLQALRACVLNWKRRRQFRKPFAMFVGGNDTRVDVADLKAFVDAAQSNDKQLSVIQDGFHKLSLDKTSVTRQYLAEIIQWLDAHSS